MGGGVGSELPGTALLLAPTHRSIRLRHLGPPSPHALPIVACHSCPRSLTSSRPTPPLPPPSRPLPPLAAPQAPLTAFLDYPKAFASLQEHQKQEYASESSEFWSDTCAFLAAAKEEEADPAALLKQATALCETYIKEGSEKQVNVPSQVQKDCLALLAAAPPLDTSLFDTSRSEIYTLIKRDTLPRFLAGDRYAALIKALGEQPMFDCEAPSTLQAARDAYATQVEASAVDITEDSGGETPKGGDSPAAAYSPNYIPGGDS